MHKKKTLAIDAELLPNGLKISVNKRCYPIIYPKKIWQAAPGIIKNILRDNLTFGNTHFLPLMLDTTDIKYKTAFPLLESFFFKNQLFDLRSCEKADRTQPLAYLRQFYNLTYDFASNSSAFPDSSAIKKFTNSKPTAIIPFTFGKESLTTLGLCLELKIKPILIYCQEPAHPYEEKYKLKKLLEIKQKFSIPVHFIKNAPGLFRYGLAFGIKNQTEIGWGAQTTLLSIMMLPFIYYYEARMILYGNEYSNNESEILNGWRMYPSYDQTSHWMTQQDNMIRLCTNNQCGVHSSLEPLEEINIFYLLHHRYPWLGKYQFSCGGAYPLYPNSQWCHRCYKCARMFLFARGLDINPAAIGFKHDLLNKNNMFDHYFGADYKTGSTNELDFAFYLAYKKNVLGRYKNAFENKKLKKLKSWQYYISYFINTHQACNLPPKYKDKMAKIFSQELLSFARLVKAV